MNRDELCAACALPKGREWKAKSLAAERHCAALEAELVELRAERDTLREMLTKQEKYEAGAWLTVQELRNERDALRLACNVSAADLIEAGRLCWITDDEYPLRAVERVVAERDTLTEKLSLVTEDYISHRNALERAEAALREIEKATEGIPEQNCAIANRIARAALRDTAPEDRSTAPWDAWRNAEARVRELEEALRTLLDRMERIEASEAYRSVWIVAQVHAGPYHGENWAVERAAARAALIDAPPRKEKP
jgi:hypothetical protein